jgi:hypothetical protein
MNAGGVVNEVIEEKDLSAFSPAGEQRTLMCVVQSRGKGCLICLIPAQLADRERSR